MTRTIGTKLIAQRAQPSKLTFASQQISGDSDGKDVRDFSTGMRKMKFVLFKNLFVALAVLPLICGCAVPQYHAPNGTSTVVSHSAAIKRDKEIVQAGAFDLDQHKNDELPPETTESLDELSLQDLEQLAMSRNPRLMRLRNEYQAAAARSRYVDKLPDPRISANVFGDPIETASGSQRANLTVSQTIPWLARLSAEQQRACCEALAIHADLESERLRVLSAIQSGWLKIHIIDHMVKVTETNQTILQSLIDIANNRISTGTATQGDVRLATLELTNLEERLVRFHRQKQGVKAELNRLVARPSNTPLPVRDQPSLGVPVEDAEAILQLARQFQPQFQAVELRNQAARWGIEIARLKRRPELMLTASHFITDDNRPASSVVNVGEDPWAIGVQVSIPLSRKKYDAIEDEASLRYLAFENSREELEYQYDSLILDLLSEAQRASETAILYRDTILPQAQLTLLADQDSYSNGAVEFDRVMRGYRAVLTLQLGYHEARGKLGIAVAQLQQLAGASLTVTELLQPVLE